MFGPGAADTAVGRADGAEQPQRVARRVEESLSPQVVPDYDLVEVPLNGSPMRDFLATGSDEYSGAWVPGSSRYVYLTNKNGEEELRIHSQTENWDRLIVAIRTFGETTA